MSIISTNNSPYFDDYDAAKNFLRILYTPSRAVQARELNQAQSILQNQVASLSDRIFADGSRVLGAEITLDFKRHALVCTVDSNGAVVDLNTLLGTSIVDVATGGQISATVDHVDTATNTLILTYKGGQFTAADQFYVVGAGVNYVIDSVHYAVTANVSNGLVYTDGFFVKVFNSEIVVDSSATALTSKHHVGFQIVDKFVDENTDATLTDNALGTYNYNAPGAHRLNRELVLSSYNDNVVAPVGFVDSIIVSNGAIATNIMKNVKYSDILDVMARRTHDESGNYVVDDFNVLPEVTVTGNTATQLDLSVGAGKAYVFGYEVENTYPQTLTINKSQAAQTVLNANVYTEYGPFFDIAKDALGADEITGTFDVNTNEEVYFYTSVANAVADATGTAPDISIAGVHPKIASIIRNNLGEVRLFVTSSQGLSSQFNSVRAIRGATTGTIATVELYSGLPVLGGTHVTPLLFPVQEQYIATITTSSITYDITKSFASTSVVNNVATFTQTNTATDSFYDGSGKVVYVRVNGTTLVPEGVGGWTLDIAATVPGSLVIDITAYATANAITVTSAEVVVNVQRTLNERTKTLVDVPSEIIATPASSTITLANSDVVDVYEVSVAGHASLPNGPLTVADYVWNDGQTDFSYDAGTVVLSALAYDVNATYTVKYKYMSHSFTGDYFTVNSYGVPYETIGSYKTSSGTLHSLSDVFDFRKSAGSLGAYPSGESYINFDYSFYLSRIDKLYIDRYGNFNTITGLSAKVPFAPADKADAMSLATITLPPYSGNVTDVAVDDIANKGYTMKDIKELEGRIESLEYYTSLNLLEQSAKDMKVLDGYGNTRFKNGIFVDNFSSHEYGDINHVEYNCSMDILEGFVHSPFKVISHKLETALFGDRVGQVAANIAITNDVIANSSSNIATLDYTQTSFINQSKATDVINVNPYAVFAWTNAQVSISPASDFWYDDVSLPVIRKTTGSYAGVGTRYSAWRSWSTGWWGWWWGSTTTTTQRTVYTTVPTTTTKINDKVVSTAWIQKMRGKAISFWGSNFRPNTVVKVFFDGKDVTANCTSPTGFKTDTTGNLHSKASPGVFNLPTSVFNTGTKTLEIKDVDIDPTTAGEADYRSTGILRTNQRTVTTIRGTRTSASTQSIVTRRSRRRRWGDPIAQSFLVENNGGVFVSAIDLFFAKKDANLPVSCEIVEMLAGQPTQNTIPMSHKVVDAASVQISNDATLATTFEFEAPIYLQDGTSYAFVVKSNSTDYELFFAKMRAPELLAGDSVYLKNASGQGVAKQPYAGVMFKSQNAETWTEDQNADVKFDIKRCSFNTASNGVLEFNIPANTAIDMSSFVSNVHHINYPNTAISFDYKFLNDIGYTPIKDGEDVNLAAEKIIASGASVPMLLRATLSSANNSISPVIDIDRASITEVLNVVGPDVDYKGVQRAGTYVSKATSLITPAEDIKVLIDAKMPAGSDVNVWFKTTPYVGRYANVDSLLLPTVSRYDLLVNKTVNIYWRDAASNVVKKGGFIPTKIGTTIAVTALSVWIRDIVNPEDLNAASAAYTAFGGNKIFAVEGTLTDTNIPDWTAGTYTLGNVVFHGNAMWKCDVATTVTEPVANATDWLLIPHVSITSAITPEAESEWRLMTVDVKPAIGADTTIFNEYSYKPDAVPDEPFSSFAVKLEMVSNNAAQVPEVSKLRVLAVT